MSATSGTDPIANSNPSSPATRKNYDLTPPPASSSSLQPPKDEDDGTSNKSKRPGRRALEKSRAEAASSLSPPTRGFSPQKVYLFFFVLVFSATYSIYQSSYSSEEYLESQFAHPHVLENDANNKDAKDDQTNRQTKDEEENEKPVVFTTSLGKEADEEAEEIRNKYLMALQDANKLLGKKKKEAEETAEEIRGKYLLALKDANKLLGKDKSEDSKPAYSGQQQQQQQQQANKPQTGGDEPIQIDKPLNIVVLYADDWRHDDLGIASNGVVHTPFLDTLSTQHGIRFTHNCVTTSVCWISRATLATGQYYSRHKATRPRDNEWYEGFDNTYPALLRKKGYHVSHIGKWHSADFGNIKHHYDLSKIYYGRHWFPGNPSPIHVTTRNEKDAVDLLQKRPKDKPFVMTVAFYAPHSWDGHPDQYCPQNETEHLYKDMTVKPKIDMEASFKRLPSFFSEKNEGRNRFRQRFATPEMYDKMMKNYWRLISGVDAACEKVWRELEAQGILNETMVIFSTDNGYYHGEHGLAGKWYPHEESIRVPLIVYDPRMPPNKRGTVDDSFTLNIDLAPTILGAAQLPKPDTHQGRDISDLYLRGGPNNNNLSPPWRTEFFYEHPIHIHRNVIPASSALVRKNIKYVRWPNFDVEQIFNLTSDPVEEQDQIKNPDYADLIAEMKTRHDELRDMVVKEHTEL